jgi:hypothetical protein
MYMMFLTMLLTIVMSRQGSDVAFVAAGAVCPVFLDPDNDF